MSMTFSQWLSHSTDTDFESFVRTRRDLLQPESPTIPSLAAAASSRIGVSRGIEALTATQLDVFIDLAKAARTSADINVRENPHIDDALAEVALPRLRDLGLAWPSSSPTEVAPSSTEAAPSSETTWRIQSEAITLLPTSAAESARAHPWQTPSATLDSSRETMPKSLIHNSERAAVAEVISSLRGLVDELAGSPISRLTSGGISKRDVTRIGKTIDLGLEQTITLLLAAKSLNLIGVLDDVLDPQWTASDDAATVLEDDRAELWAALVTSWLRESLDVTQLTAGTSANERLTVLASPKKSLFKGFSQSQPTMPLLRFTILEILNDIGLGSARSIEWIHAQVLATRPLIPAHDFAMTEAILHTSGAFGLATTPLQNRDHFGPSRFGAFLGKGLKAAMSAQAAQDPSIAPVNFSLESLEVPTDVIDTVRLGLVDEVDSVLIQSDLTAVATGPIEPRVHHILRRFAIVEARGQGTVYRIDADTIEASMQAGTNADDALAQLAEISAEPLPSTLKFLIENTASKLRRVQVAGARAVLVVDDPVDLDVILSDQAMLPAGLERLTPTVAIGQLGPERTMHLLESAEHHAMLHSPAGPVRKRRVITQAEPELHLRKRARVDDAHLDDYIRILRSPGARMAPITSTDEPLGHMGRLRDAAEAGQMVTIRLADSHGKERIIDMIPGTVNGGRVRGKVKTTGAEASLSIARIVSVDVVEEQS